MNLSQDSLGKMWCPKINDTVDPDPTNLSGCAHCAYCVKSHKDSHGRFLGVTCKLVPKIQFCERQKFEDDGAWVCLIEPDLTEYKQLTGHIEAEHVPDGFRIPRPVTFIQCLMCAATGHERFLPPPKSSRSPVFARPKAHRFWRSWIRFRARPPHYFGGFKICTTQTSKLAIVG